MPQSPTAIPSVITMENTDGIISSVKFSRELFFLACLAVFFLFPTQLATEWEITDNQYSDGRIPSVRPSVKLLPTTCMPCTDGMNESVVK
jgi:hypothetical protein